MSARVDAPAAPAAGRLRPRSQRVATVTLTGLVCWLLAAGRWGSYVGVPRTSVYLTDLLLLAVGLSVLRSWRDAGTRCRARLRSPAGVALLVLVGWAVLRLLAGGVPDPVALRDFAPYLYAVTALLSAVVGARLTSRVLTGVLTFHVAWVLLALRGWAPTQIGLGPTTVFALRNDIDACVCGIAVIWCLLRLPGATARLKQAGYLTLLLLAGYLLLNLENRAAVIATGVALMPVVHGWCRPLSGTSQGRRQLLAVGAAGLVVVVTALVFSSTGEKLVGTLTGSNRGTMEARGAVYEEITSYVTQRPGRLVVGVGFGPDFMHITGADVLYEGTEYTGVRSPHNFVLGTLARLGVVGAVAQLLLVVAIGAVAWRRLALRIEQAPAELLACLLVLALPVLALFGVVLESPFGAVPYFWAVGLLLPTVPALGRWPLVSRLLRR